MGIRKEIGTVAEEILDTIRLVEKGRELKASPDIPESEDNCTICKRDTAGVFAAVSAAMFLSKGRRSRGSTDAPLPLSGQDENIEKSSKRIANRQRRGSVWPVDATDTNLRHELQSEYDKMMTARKTVVASGAKVPFDEVLDVFELGLGTVQELAQMINIFRCHSAEAVLTGMMNSVVERLIDMRRSNPDDNTRIPQDITNLAFQTLTIISNLLTDSSQKGEFEMKEEQLRLTRLGAPRFVVALISMSPVAGVGDATLSLNDVMDTSDSTAFHSFTDSLSSNRSLMRSAVKCGIALLNGGNKGVQRCFFRALTNIGDERPDDTDDSGDSTDSVLESVSRNFFSMQSLFFRRILALLSQSTQTRKEIRWLLYRQTTVQQEKMALKIEQTFSADEAESDLDGFAYDAGRDVLRLLQLFCENHYNPLQVIAYYPFTKILFGSHMAAEYGKRMRRSIGNCWISVGFDLAP